MRDIMAPQWLQNLRGKNTDALPVVEEEKRAHTSSDTEAAHHSINPGKEAGVDSKAVTDGHSETDSASAEGLSKDAQYGVKKIEATTMVWSKNMLILAYVL